MAPDVKEPEDYGKKVYFVRPHSVLHTELVRSLVWAQFEVGLIEDHTKAEALFRRHPDCIAFLNIDDGWSLDEWDRFIRKVQADEALSQVRLGIVTYDDSPDLAERYLLHLRLPAGFVRLSLGVAASTAIILKVLEANEARGRRRFLRVACDRESAEVSLEVDRRRISGTIQNLSVKGMACVFDPDPGLPTRLQLPQIQVRLKGKAFTVGALLVARRALPGGPTLYVFLFHPQGVVEHRQEVRTFLQTVVQNQLEAELSRL